jgi:hypothetical protein
MNCKLEAQWAEPMSLTFHSALRKLNTEPSIGATHQVSVHLAKQFPKRRFLEINQPETRYCSFRPNSLTNMATTDNSCF